MRYGRIIGAALTLALLGAGLSGCSTNTQASGKIVAVGAENQYADVIRSIGGSQVKVTAILSNPNTDPHSFEASPKLASTLGSAQLVVRNGLGYDDWLTKLLKGTKTSDRTVISAQQVRHLPDSTKNPHLWYDPATMPAVATRIAASLTKVRPAKKAYFAKNLATFTRSMSRYTDALATLKAAHPGLAVAATEPVANYLLDAVGADIKTPWSLQAAIMNGTDPSAQDSATQERLFTSREVNAFVYNEQVTSSLTTKYRKLAIAHGIPIVAVYETMPAGYGYVDWMVAEVHALQKAADSGTSTRKLAR